MTFRFGVNIPAVTIRLLMTKHDMRKGKKTGCPVSVPSFQNQQLHAFRAPSILWLCVCSHNAFPQRKKLDCSGGRRTRMQCRINHLLRLPDDWGHRLLLPLLISRHKILRIFKPRPGHKQGPNSASRHTVSPKPRHIMMFWCPQAPLFTKRSFQAWSIPLSISHLGSDISADCLTRPQYVERSYCDAGRSRAPGREDDMMGEPLRKGAVGGWGGVRAMRSLGWATELVEMLRSR